MYLCVKHKQNKIKKKFNGLDYKKCICARKNI